MKIDRDTIYGELTHHGINQLFGHFSHDGNFMDIGSGYGKVVTAFNSIFQKKAFGIEIVKEKHDIAKKIWKNKPHKYEFINGNFKDHFKIMDKCKYFYANCIMWKEETMTPLQDYFLNKRKKPFILIYNPLMVPIWPVKQNIIKLDVCWRDGGVTFYKLNTIND